MKSQQLSQLNPHPEKQQKPKQNKDQPPTIFKQNINDCPCESSIAQEEFVMLSETLINSKQNKKNTPNIQFLPKQLEKVQNKKLNKNSSFLLAESFNNKAKIVTIHQVKAYEQKAKNQYSQFKLSLSRELVLIKAQYLKQQKHLKKSLSSSKFSRQRQSVVESRQLIRGDQNQESINNKKGRRSGEFEKINRGSTQKIVVNRILATTPMPVPFSMQNINSAINNLQKQNEFQFSQRNNPIKLSESKDKRRNNEDNMLRRESLNKSDQCSLLKKVSLQRYLVDVPLDLNQFQYQIKMELSLQKNRGLQLFLVRAQSREQRGSCESIQSSTLNSGYEDIQHFKYEIIQLPYNIIRLRVYLLICPSERTDSRQYNRKICESSSESSFPENNSIRDQCRLSQSIIATRTQWKVWKEVQMPLISLQKEGSNCQNQNLSPKICITITNVNLNCVRVQINNIIDFHLNLNHPKLPLSYYCIRQDSDGVELTKLSISGSQSIKIPEDFGQGCHSKCQLI